MVINLTEEQMRRAIQTLLQGDKIYREQLVSELTPEEYERFLKECPEFLEDE